MDVRDEVRERLARAGCVAAEAEADELLAVAGSDPTRLASLLGRREAGEPLEWLVGTARFWDGRLEICPGVYVPRPHSELLVAEAARRLPRGGRAVDLCTGSGALAWALTRARPDLTVVATESDPTAVACARRNGVQVYEGRLGDPLPPGLAGQVDGVVGVVPYVPSDELRLLARDVQAYESRLALDGGAQGIDVLIQAVATSAALLRPGGWLLLELGAGQDALLASTLRACGFRSAEALVDAEGDLRAISARWDAVAPPGVQTAGR